MHVTRDMLALAYASQVRARGRNADELDEVTRRNVDRVASWLCSETAKPMLLLYGGYGNGKTTMVLAVQALCRSLRDATDQRGRSIIDLNQDEIRELYSLQKSILVPRFFTAQQLAGLATSDRDAFEAAAAVKFIAIDDLGCEPVAVKNWGTEVTPVTDILYRRYDEMLPTIVTTNLNKQDIRRRYGDRIADRFNETFDTIGYTSPSYRK